MTAYSENPDRSPDPSTPPERHPLTLSPPDAAALDAALDNAPLAASACPVDPARRQRIDQWLAVLAAARVPQPPADLAARTLGAVAADRAASENSRRRHDERLAVPGVRFGQQFAQFAAMALAACLLVVVLISGLGAARQSAKRVACVANLAALGTAFDAYATTYHNALPSLTQPADNNWLPHDVRLVSITPAAGHSNTANLLPLVREEQVSTARFVCPARVTTAVEFDAKVDEIPDAIRGYSYLNLFTRPGANSPHHTWDHQTTTIVLADRNPLFAAPACRDPLANSLNHGRRGTNILAADGSVRWVITPNVGPANDNIWTIGQNCQPCYTGTEVAEADNDLFLSP